MIISTPVHEAARLVAPHEQRLADCMLRIPMAGVAVGVLGIARSQLTRCVDGFGFVMPFRANRPIIAGSFASVKFAGRAPDGRVLLRVFVGGACQSELLDLEDEQIKDLIWNELVDILGAEGKPDFFQLHRWQDKMPQYHVGHVELVDEIERLTQPIAGLELAGNAYRGVGIPFCVRSGEQAAERLLNSLPQNTA